MHKESIVYNQEAVKHLSSVAIKNIEIWQTDQKYKEFFLAAHFLDYKQLYQQ